MLAYCRDTPEHLFRLYILMGAGVLPKARHNVLGQGSNLDNAIPSGHSYTNHEAIALMINIVSNCNWSSCRTIHETIMRA